MGYFLKLAGLYESVLYGIMARPRQKKCKDTPDSRQIVSRARIMLSLEVIVFHSYLSKTVTLHIEFEISYSDP